MHIASRTVIAALVLLAVYWAAREKRRVRRQMDKMKIDDL